MRGMEHVRLVLQVHKFSGTSSLSFHFISFISFGADGRNIQILYFTVEKVHRSKFHAFIMCCQQTVSKVISDYYITALLLLQMGSLKEYFDTFTIASNQLD